MGFAIVATVLAQATVHAGRDHPPRPRRRITVVWYGAHIPAPLRRHPASAPLAPLRARSNSSPREIMVFGDGGNRLGDSSMGFVLDLPASACRPAISRPRDKAALLAGSSEFRSGLACRRAACPRGVDANGLAGFGVLFPFWPPSSQLL
jgi:hypothetical protein